MLTCNSCGGDNPPGKLRCQYCDRVLVETRALDLEWSARTESGTSGRGRLELQVPVSAEAGQLRQLAQAAFSAAVADAGPDAGPERVRTAMEQRLGALLPRDHRVVTLTVEALDAFVLVGRPVDEARPFHARATPAAGGSGARPLLGLGACGLGSCCLLWGAVALAAGGDVATAIGRAERARVVTAAEAAQADGLVCVEGATAVVDSVLTIPGDATPYLVLVRSETRTDVVQVTRTRTRNGRRETETRDEVRETAGAPVTRAVSRFRAGGLTVDPTGAELDELAPVAGTQVDGASTYTYKGLRADQPLTIIGTARRGAVANAPDDRLLISTRSDRAAVVTHLRSLATGMRGVGVAGLVVGLVGALVGARAFARKGA